MLLFEDTDPSWSPDGKWIAYTHFRRDTIGWDGIYIIDTSGTTLKPYIKGGRDPDWSPDGSYIAFVYSRNIYIASTDSTSEIIQLTNNGNSFEPSFSPDGNWIAFNISITTKNDTSGINIIKVDRSCKYWAIAGVMNDWSTSGFVYAKGVSVKPGYSHAEIFICDSEGRNIKRLTYNGNDTGMEGYSSGYLDNNWPSWSPDGKYIAWQHDWEVWIMNADGSNQKRLTDGERPSWSPDSKKIVFSRYVEDHNALYIMNCDGTNIEKITGHETYRK